MAGNSEELVGAMLATYDRCPNIHHVDRCALPSRHGLVSIVESLRELLFPGFGRRQNLRRETLRYHVGELLEEIRERLAEQIGRAMRHDRPERGCTSDDFTRLGADAADAFLVTLPGIAAMLHDDVQAAFDGDPAAVNPIETAFCYPGVEAVTTFRVAHELHRLGVPLIPRMMTEHAHGKTGIDIHPGATIGRSFFIDHGSGVVIGETCVIGDHVKLYQGVTLGALSFPKDAAGKLVRGQKRHPTLEEGVVVYANATILGGDTVVGHHSVVGSSVWLTESVEPHTTVTMEKARPRYRQEQRGG